MHPLEHSAEPLGQISASVLGQLSAQQQQLVHHYYHPFQQAHHCHLVPQAHPNPFQQAHHFHPFQQAHHQPFPYNPQLAPQSQPQPRHAPPQSVHVQMLHQVPSAEGGGGGTQLWSVSNAAAFPILDGLSFSNSGPLRAPLSVTSLTGSQLLVASDPLTVPPHCGVAPPPSPAHPPRTRPEHGIPALGGPNTQQIQNRQAAAFQTTDRRVIFDAAFPHMRPLEPNEGNPGSNLIVNYIPTEVSESELRQIFEQFGPVQSACTVKNATTRCSREYGFVLFSETADAIKARQALHGFFLYGKRLRVAFANNQAFSALQQQQQQHQQEASGSIASPRLLAGGSQASAFAFDGSATHPTVMHPMAASESIMAPGGLDISLSLHSTSEGALPGGSPAPPGLAADHQPVLGLVPLLVNHERAPATAKPGGDNDAHNSKESHRLSAGINSTSVSVLNTPPTPPTGSTTTEGSNAAAAEEPPPQPAGLNLATFLSTE